MGMILDSCIWIALATGKLSQEEVINAAADSEIFVSVITLGELSFGVHSCKNPAERAVRAAFLRQLEIRPVLDISQHTASGFGLLAAAIKHSGRSPRPRYNDLWIAAQAIENGHSLLTLNSNDFIDLPGLEIVSIVPSTGNYPQP